MRTVSFVATAMLLCDVCAGQAWAKEALTAGENALARSGVTSKEARRATDIESLHTLLNRIRGQKHVSIQDNSNLGDIIGRLTEDTILGLAAGGRQELVRKTVGEEDYSMLERTFLGQLSSPDEAQQRSALRSLGYPLFVVDAADRVKAFVFHSDRMTQYLAVRSLVYLDVAGANALLKDMIRSSALKDQQLSQAIDALYVSNDRGLDELAMTLVERDPGGMTFKSLLPILKKRADYRDIVRQVFKSGMFYVPDREGLPMEQQWKALAEHDLLEEIVSDPKFFMADDAIKKKVLIYASATHNNLYTLALVALEKSGQDIDFFTEMMKDSQVPAAKKQVLSQIITRIRKGQRLS